VIATSIPEPETYVLVLAGLVLVSTMVQRKLSDDIPTATE